MQWKLRQKNWLERGVLFLLGWGLVGTDWWDVWNVEKYAGSLKEVEQVCKWCTLWHYSLTVPRCPFLSKRHAVLWYTSKFNFVVACMKSMAWTALICVNTQMLNSILCRLLSFNQMRIDVESMDINPLTPLRKVWWSLSCSSWNSHLLASVSGGLLHRISFNLKQAV